MPRRNRPPQRVIAPDVRYNNIHVEKFINRMMFGGKKSTARQIMYQAFTLIEERLKRDPAEVFEVALRNVTPIVEVKARRVGGSTYQVPVEITPDRARSLAMRWLLTFARGRGGRGMVQKLSAEIIDAFHGQGNTVKRKDDTHRMAEANKAYAHFR